MDWKAKWIWKKRRDYLEYNQTVIAKKMFYLEEEADTAVMAVSADTWYRLYINQEWINDGPARGYPEHYPFDVIDVQPYLKSGWNEVWILSKFWGCAASTRISTYPGLIAQIEVVGSNGRNHLITTDHSWEMAEAWNWPANTPEASFSQGPFEVYDARRESECWFEPAEELLDTGGGFERNFTPIHIPLMGRNPVSLRNFEKATVVDKRGRTFCFPFVRLLHPGWMEFRDIIAAGAAVFTVIRTEQACTKEIRTFGLDVTLDGNLVTEKIQLKKGDNFVAAISSDPWGFHRRDLWIYFANTDGLEFRNPLLPAPDSSWCFLPLEESDYIKSSLIRGDHPDPEREKALQHIQGRLHEIKSFINHEDILRQYVQAKPGVIHLNDKIHLLEDPHPSFVFRRPLPQFSVSVQRPEALLYDSGECTTVVPAKDGDIELLYDLGAQHVGYVELDFISQEGVILDVFAIEYMKRDGTIQHTIQAQALYRNGFRYIAKAGRNRFVSSKRIAGRYLFVTIRNQRETVKIKNIRLVESTYPVQHQSSFACSNPVLNQIWEISEHTLKLCMEDTFTDCPLYEQNFWVGDLRNEALFAYSVFGAYDLARRCLLFAAQSLEKLPLIGPCLPGPANAVLPAWSFLWNLSVWEYFVYTGDEEFVKEIWPTVLKNLENAEQYKEQGLFSAPFWNLFDWAPSDWRGRKTVLYNSMLLAAALDAGARCAGVINDEATQKILDDRRRELIDAINQHWDDRNIRYPDSIGDSGEPSRRSSMHTLVLALLYDILPEKDVANARKTLLNPPQDLVQMASPFAVQYELEALEKLCCEEEIIKRIETYYEPMLQEGATTVWEVFPGTSYAEPDFPTRSHAHAWSSAPVYFFHRIVLGVKCSRAGAKEYVLSPRLCGLHYAKGRVVTVYGNIEVEWSLSGNQLHLDYEAPAEITVKFECNDSIRGYEISINKRARREP